MLYSARVFKVLTLHFTVRRKHQTAHYDIMRLLVEV